MSRCLFLVLVKVLVADGVEVVAVVDDTLNKHCGKQICGAGWQYDGSAPKRGKKAKQTSFGLCFVIIGLAIRLPGISDRVFCLPYAARLGGPRRPKSSLKGFPTRPNPS